MSSTQKLRIHPKVMLIDLDNGLAERLKEKGYNVESGTFGHPYLQEEGLSQVVEDCRLPGYGERDIVFVDVASPSAMGEPRISGSPAELGWWMKSTGSIDPRPTAMDQMRGFGDRILAHGGIFVVFSDVQIPQTYQWGRVEGGYFHKAYSRVLSNWSFLSGLGDLEIRPDYGDEVSVSDGELPLQRLLRHFKSELSLNCTLSPTYGGHLWHTLAKNKYKQTIAGLISPQQHSGKIILLPRIADPTEFVTALLESVLPDIAPYLFEDDPSGRWVHEKEYELPRVLELKQDIIQVQEAADLSVAQLNQTILVERDRMGFMYDLLRATGDQLVAAVKRALETLGFASVIDVDQGLEPGQRKREDLQIRDGSPVLLVEVKGIAGLPAEHDAIQVLKYVAPRMKEWNRTDVAGLSIINHQRHLPGLHRSQQPFTEDVLTNAIDQQFGLITTWELFRLLRSFLKLGWPPGDVKPLFYGCGRINPFPIHYQPLGVIEHCWDKAGAVGIQLSDGPLDRGDRIAFQLPIEFEEQIVESLQIDGNPANRAEKGTSVGVKPT